MPHHQTRYDSTDPCDPEPAAPSVDGISVRITHAQMNAAYDAGEAVPLAQSVSWLARYQDAWWVVYESGWLRITDELTAADIDDRAARLTTAGTVPVGGEEEPCPPPR
jgi:hypothetical protein